MNPEPYSMPGGYSKFQAQQMQNTSSTKVEARPIDAALSKLSEDIGALSQALANLESKLIPYLQPEGISKDAPPSAPYPVTSVTVNKIFMASTDIIAAVRFIERLDARLD